MKITAKQLKNIIKEVVAEVEGDLESVYQPTSTPPRQASPADRPSTWSVVASYEKSDLRPGDRVVQSSRGAAAKHSHKDGVRLHMTPDWGPSVEDPTVSTTTTGENPVVGRLPRGESATVVSLWKAAADDMTSLPWGASKLVELETDDGMAGFAPAHWFVKI